MYLYIYKRRAVQPALGIHLLEKLLDLMAEDVCSPTC